MLAAVEVCGFEEGGLEGGGVGVLEGCCGRGGGGGLGGCEGEGEGEEEESKEMERVGEAHGVFCGGLRWGGVVVWVCVRVLSAQVWRKVGAAVRIWNLRTACLSE